ncbi:unnamed protein product, partial [Linum tenue]
MIIKVVRDEDIRNDIGKTRYFDLADHDKVTSFRVPNLLVFQTLQATPVTSSEENRLVRKKALASCFSECVNGCMQLISLYLLMPINMANDHHQNKLHYFLPKKFKAA